LFTSEYETAVAKARHKPAKIPAHIDIPEGKEYPAWTTKVIQRNAPGAISAIALTVTPVSPRVGFIVGSELCAICGPERCAIFFTSRWRTKVLSANF
jgi:hypothetical protein